jgi:TRAP-type C4-dicarboxylate transport system permease small subunit
MQAVDKLAKGFDRTNKYLYFLSAVLILCMFVIMLLDVGLRLINIPFRGALSIIEYGLLFFTFLGAAHLLKEDGHIRMDLVINSTKPRNRHIINAFTSTIAALLWLVVAIYSSYSVWDAIQLNLVPPALLLVPRAPILAVIPLGSLLLFIQSVRKTVGYIRDFQEARGSTSVLR